MRDAATSALHCAIPCSANVDSLLRRPGTMLARG